ncbi:MAG: nitrate reductase cytochrome c-type subunit [Campylobacterota bacterium]|nr:nitrate reductase cytochrome c-type subunit [Campylobacterota bacterium]
MKMINKITLSLAVASSILLTGCNDSTEAAKPDVAKATITEASLGLRKTDLYSETAETVGEETNYGKATAGTSETITRAFQDAPPMIPHDVDGMLPITIKDNQCKDCHMPGVAESMGALPYPVSHMMNFRPDTAIASDGRISLNGKAIDNTSDTKQADISIKELGTLSGSRFNCSQCHAPQSEIPALVGNNFEADFTSKDGASKSSWSGGSLMDGLDTLAD